MIEAMACGTPVVAWNCGSVPEIIDPGVTGFIVRTENEALEAIARIGRLNRKCIRETYESRFTAAIMADAYLNVYHQLLYGRQCLRTYHGDVCRRVGVGGARDARQGKNSLR
jgi:glycosyltransferase involved in cell wall biosynthesis